MARAPMFDDRRDAGRQLAAALADLHLDHPVILAVPRGGVPIGYEIARALGAPLDIVVVRKLGAPDQPELGIGAVADGDHPLAVLNQELVDTLAVAPDYLDREVTAQLGEIRRREAMYRGDRTARGGRTPPPVTGRIIVVVDDGLATGGTMRAALRSVRRAGPTRLVLAVPVAPADALASIAADVDAIVCLATPDPFGAVGYFYRDFAQTTDEEVIRLLAAAGGTPLE